MLNDVHHVAINGGVFNDIGGNLIYNIVSESTQDILSKKIQWARHAAYNTPPPGQRQTRGCTAGTRMSILSALMTWATDGTDTKIYWLSGMAGTGKTTIAYSFSESLERNRMLGATFFCSRAEADTKNSHLIFPTIAYGLARRYPSMCPVLVDVLRRDPDAGNRVMARQFSDLIIAPLQAASDELNAQPAIIVIDALDECDNQSNISDLLSIISRYSPYLPVKFFITSRPEPQIRRGFNRQEFEPYSRFLLHDVEKDIVSADIELYAREQLLDTADGRSDFHELLDDWPPEDQLKTLVRLAGCLFIYAATACEYVGGGGNICERLAVVTTISPRTWNGKTDALDALYDNILAAAYESADEKEREDIRQVLRAVVGASNPPSTNELSMLLNLSVPQIRGSLSSLHSVICIPPSADPTLPISTFHTSFQDYITDHTRSRDNFLDPLESHRRLALHCLDLMQKRLRTNICRLEGRPRNTDIPQSTIMESIPEGLAYACTYWASHVANTNISGDVLEAVIRFFDSKVLLWVECMSLIDRLPVTITSLKRLESWAKTCPTLLNAVIDAHRFITENVKLLKDYCRETYSALAWLPEMSRIRMKYFTEQNRVLKMIGRTRRTWGDCEFVLVGHSKTVTSLRISPDGSRIASGSMDKTIRIWDMATGESEVVLKGHSDAVNAIHFSSDGSHIVSGATDGTIRIWDVVTGELHGVFKASMVLPIILSPDGNRLAIASCNKLKIFHIWKTSKGRLEFVLTNPSSGNLTSIVFSPDGSRIAAGSADATVSIWNLMKGKLETSLKGHSQCVNMVNFSPDGSRIVSAADDIRIWNSRTHHLELVLKGYSGSVKSLVFSPEGTYIMSAHTDMKIRIWDTATGELKDNLQGVHGAPVTHVAFSIDGSRMISISDDQRVSIWRFTATGPSRTVLAGYLDQANSVLFSPDGTRVISGSDDHKVRIWRTDMEATPEFDVVLLGHHERVNYIEFSPDGSRFLSASEDQTIRIWNASTGNLEGVLKESADVKQARFSPDGSRIVSIKRIWNPATGEYIVREGFGSVIFSDGHQLPPLPPLDHKVPRGVGGRVYRGFHEMPISPKEAPNLGIISRNRRWILYPGGGRRCWLPGPYRSFTALASHNSKICLGFETGMLLLLEMFNPAHHSAPLSARSRRTGVEPQVIQPQRNRFSPYNRTLGPKPKSSEPMNVLREHVVT